MVYVLHYKPTLKDLSSSAKPAETVHKEPVYLESGRMACVPAWEQDAIEWRKRWFEEHGAKIANFEARTEAIITEVLTRPGK